MLLLHVVFLWAIVCLHVVGGAVLFRKYFRAESPWWGFFLPSLVLVSLLNFVEHFVALPVLAWILPFSSGGLVWVMSRPDVRWRGLGLPTTLFLISFAYTLLVRCTQPDINFYCTEGLTDITRILDFCLGDKLPATDCWLPPYPHTGYYTFMMYGASVMKRIMAIDIGTTYNLAFALVNALTLLAGAAAAHTLSRYRAWVAVLVLIMLVAGFTGSTPIIALQNLGDPNPTASIDIGGGDDDTHAIFRSLLQRNLPEIGFRLYLPGCYVYYSEFHATQAGHFLALLSVFAAAEVLRRKRTIAPWVYLLVVPTLAVLSCTWFILIVGLLAAPTLVLAWMTGRKPRRWSHVALGTAVSLMLLWPAFVDMIGGCAPQKVFWAQDLTHDLWTIVIQWWPIYVPWFVLWFAWPRMSLTARWLHFMVLPVFMFIELIFVSDRGTTLEKTWGGVFGISIVILYPILFSQRGWFFRGMSAVIIAAGFISFYSWNVGVYMALEYNDSNMHLEGDYFMKRSPEQNRLLEVVSQLHGQTILPGIERRAFFLCPAVATFTNNRSYLGWTNAEETTGHPEEANQRETQTNELYAGTMAHPIEFLESHGIAAVVIFPDDKYPDDMLEKLKAKLQPDYAYFDCRSDFSPDTPPDQRPPNGGVFIRKTLMQTKPTN